MRRSGIALACLVAAAGWARAVSPDPADLVVKPEVRAQTRALVEQLGSEDYAEREEAQKQLAAFGRLARPELLAGARNSPNPEVRRRVAELLTAASAYELRARIDTFLADAAGDYEHDLPAWKSFRATACTEWSVFGQVVWSNRDLENGARQVYAELISRTDSRRVMEAAEGSRFVLTELVAARRQELYNQRYPRGGEEPRDPALEDVTAILFAESRIGSLVAPRRSGVGSLLSASGFYAAARGTDDKAQVYRAIAAAWLESRNEPREMYQAISIASHLELTDTACGLAARLLAMPGVNTQTRSRAASSLVDLGGRKHACLLEKALEDRAVVENIRPAGRSGNPEIAGYDIQVRDLALVVSIFLTKQRPMDYGFADRYAGDPDYENISFSSRRYYFPDDAARDGAFVKWAVWRKSSK